MRKEKSDKPVAVAVDDLDDKKAFEIAREAFRVVERATRSRPHLLVTHVNGGCVTIHTVDGDTVRLGQDEQIEVPVLRIAPLEEESLLPGTVYLSHAILLRLGADGDAVIRLDTKGLPRRRAGAMHVMVEAKRNERPSSIHRIPPGGAIDLETRAELELLIVGMGFSLHFGDPEASKKAGHTS